MEHSKLRRALAVVGLVCMAIFTVTFVIALYNPKLCNGVFSYAALVSGLLGVGFFLVVRFALRPRETSDYLPQADDDGEEGEDESADGENTDENEPADGNPTVDRPQDDEKNGENGTH